MTELDAFKPEGQALHPLDLFAMIYGGCSMVEVKQSPSPVDATDWARNVGKDGTIFDVNGDRYFVTNRTSRQIKPSR